MTDVSLMPFGKFKGEKMANVPAEYLIWLFKNDKCYGELKNYIKDNLDVLNEELKRKQKQS